MLFVFSSLQLDKPASTRNQKGNQKGHKSKGSYMNTSLAVK